MLHFLLASAIAWQIQQGPQSAAAVDAGDSFEAVGVSWAAASRPSVRVRVSNDRVTGSEWMPLALDGDLTDESEGRYFSAITHFGAPQRYLEYAFDGPAGGVTLTFFPPAQRGSRSAEWVSGRASTGVVPTAKTRDGNRRTRP